MTAETREDPWLFPVTVGFYRDKRFDNLEKDIAAELAKLTEVFAPFRMVPEDWDVDQDKRGGDAVNDRLRSWFESEDTRDTLLYWAGHGWMHGGSVALAHARATYDVITEGVSPATLAQAALSRAWTREDAWLIVVIEACQSAEFASRVYIEMLRDRPRMPRRFLLLGVSGEGRTRLGEFRKAFHSVVEGEFKTDDQIPIAKLGELMRGALRGSFLEVDDPGGRAALRRAYPEPTNIALDVRSRLAAILERLTPDQRRHFVAKAQGPETNVLMWLFSGRAADLRQMLSWLGNPDGMLVVTGGVGSGKSALLGHVFMLSQPELRDLLVERDLIAAPPPEFRAFEAVDATVLLTGESVGTVVARMGRALGFDGEPPPGEVEVQVDWLRRRLADRVAARGRSITMIIDALDETVEPVEIARDVLARIGDVPRVRLIVGTRRSTGESPGGAEPAEWDILQALRPEGGPMLELRYEPEAVHTYVTRLLAEAMPALGDEAVRAAAGAVSGREREFLYARLAVHEILARPELLRPDRAAELTALLDLDYPGLFRVAVDRLTGHQPENHALLTALAVAEGRGLPLLDGIWQAVAQACAGTGVPIERPAVDNLLRQAEPYLLVDREHQTVFRLAHRAFAELLAAGADPELRPAVVRALLATVPPDGPVNPYVVHHLADHAGLAPPAWREIAGRLDVLDRLDPVAVATYAFHTGLATVPPAVVGTAVMRDRLVGPDGVAGADRPGWRQIGMLQLGHRPGRPHAGTWSLRWGAVTPRIPCLPVGFHDDEVSAVVAVPRDDGGWQIASGGRDRTVRVWAAGAGDRRLATLPARVRCLAVLGTAVVAGANDGRLWILDPGTGASRSWPSGHRAVLSVATVPHPHCGVAVLSGGEDGSLRLWDPAAQEQIGPSWTGHANGGVLCIATFAAADGSTGVVSGGTDGTLRRWDPRTGEQVGAAWTGHSGGGVRTIEAFDGRPAGTVILSGGSDGTIRRWDPETGTQLGSWEVAGDRPVVTALRMVVPFLVSASDDTVLRLWDPLAGRQVGRAWAGHDRPVRALAVATGRGGDELVVSAGDDRSVRMWDFDTAVRQWLGPAYTGRVLAVAGLPRPAPARLGAAAAPPGVVSGGDDGIRFWAAGWDRWHGPAGPVSVVCPVFLGDGRRAVVSGGQDGTCRLWDAGTGDPLGEPWRGHAGRVTALTAVAGGLVVSAGADRTLRLWDPASGTQVGEPWTGHAVSVTAATALPGGTRVVSGGGDSTLRLWDVATGTQVGDPWRGHGRGMVRAVVTAEGDGWRVASAGADATIRFWHADGSPAAGPWTASRTVTAMAAYDRTRLVLAARDTVQLWDPASRAVVAQARLPFPVTSLCVVDEVVTVATTDGVVAVELAVP